MEIEIAHIAQASEFKGLHLQSFTILYPLDEKFAEQGIWQVVGKVHYVDYQINTTS